MRITDLKFDPQNANKGTERGRKALTKSLELYGAGRSILVDKKGRVIAGNKTLEQAIASGHKDVLVVKTDGSKLVAVQRIDLDLKDKRAKALAIADNRVGELDLEWDGAVLAELGKDIDLSAFWSPKELEELLGRDKMPEEAPEPKIDQAAALQKLWKTRTGQIWAIPSASGKGNHRLMCGDSTQANDVARLMCKEKAILFATDPPYAVDYSGGSHPQSKSNDARVKDKNWSDKYKEAELGREFYAGFVKMAVDHAILPGSAWYCWHASKRQAMLESVWDEFGAFVHQQIIWFKSRPVLTYSTYMWQHEPCFHGWMKGKKPAVKRHDCTTVWQIDNKEIESSAHPTSKPVRLFEIPMEMHTNDGDLCYEPFSGSGSQLIAAERTGRRCNAMEISPAFVAVALQRLSDMGLKPKLAAGSN